MSRKLIENKEYKISNINWSAYKLKYHKSVKISIYNFIPIIFCKIMLNDKSIL